MQINRNTRVNQLKDIFINASPELVWHVLTTVPEWTEWHEEMTKAAADMPLSEGSEFSWQAEGVRMKCRVASFLPHEEFGWTGKSFWYTHEYLWRIKPYKDGTHILVESSTHGRLTKQFGNKLKEKLKKSLISWTQQLKIVCEHDAGTAQG